MIISTPYLFLLNWEFASSAKELIGKSAFLKIIIYLQIVLKITIFLKDIFDQIKISLWQSIFLWLC